jgi:hypothetical protein
MFIVIHMQLNLWAKVTRAEYIYVSAIDRSGECRLEYKSQTNKVMNLMANTNNQTVVDGYVFYVSFDQDEAMYLARSGNSLGYGATVDEAVRAVLEGDEELEAV